MILSDVSQRRFLVDSMSEVRRISSISRNESILIDYYKIEKDLYLITVTNMKVGDFYSTNMIALPGLARLDKEDIKIWIDDIGFGESKGPVSGKEASEALKNSLRVLEMNKEYLKKASDILEEIKRKPTEKSKENGAKLMELFDKLEKRKKR